MSNFDALIMGHLVGDFLFQTAWMAEGKNKHAAALVVHSAVYTLCVFLFSSAVGFLRWRDYLIILGTHLLIDSRIPSNWWMRTVMKASPSGNSNDWLVIAVDQIFHLVVIYLLLL